MPELKQALTESQLRVRTMALTHQLLYEKRDFSSIALGSYLQQLCQLVRQSLSHHCQINFDFSAIDQHLVLELEQAIPCGLFINEVLTNAIKHAFPERQSGLIRLELSKSTDQYIHLAIIDDGCRTGGQRGTWPGNVFRLSIDPYFYRATAWRTAAATLPWYWFQSALFTHNGEASMNSNIMIVEDEHIVALDLKMSLEDLGHTVVATLAYGEEVLATANQLKPDLVLMDIQLAGSMRGTEAARLLYSEMRLPVIFLSAFCDDAI